MLNQDFKEFAALLNSTKVEYLIVGGYALAAYGRPRYTGDLDIWLRSTPENAARLIEALAQFGFGSLGLSIADFSKPNSVVQLGFPPARIDLLTSIDGVEFDDCFSRRLLMEIDGLSLPFIGMQEFRKNKLASGRMRDLADLESLNQPPGQK